MALVIRTSAWVPQFQGYHNSKVTHYDIMLPGNAFHVHIAAEHCIYIFGFASSEIYSRVFSHQICLAIRANMTFIFGLQLRFPYL
jgi:hypothetical protein